MPILSMFLLLPIPASEYQAHSLEFDEIIQAVRQAKAMIAFNSMRRKAAKAGYMTDEAIEAAIADARNGG